MFLRAAYFLVECLANVCDRDIGFQVVDTDGKGHHTSNEQVFRHLKCKIYMGALNSSPQIPPFTSIPL
jgi:hypothetical protein